MRIIIAIILLGIISLESKANELDLNFLLKNYKTAESAQLFSKNNTPFIKVQFKQPKNFLTLSFSYSIEVPFTQKNVQLLLSHGLKKDRFFGLESSSKLMQSRFNVDLHADEVLLKNKSISIPSIKL